MEQSGRQADLAAVWYTESRLMRRLGSRGRVSLSLSLSPFLSSFSFAFGISFPFLLRLHHLRATVSTYQRERWRTVPAEREAAVINKINSKPNIYTQARDEMSWKQRLPAYTASLHSVSVCVSRGPTSHFDVAAWIHEKTLSLRGMSVTNWFSPCRCCGRKRGMEEKERMEQRVFDVLRLWPRGRGEEGA